jgi:UPF0755 protein
MLKKSIILISVILLVVGCPTVGLYVVLNHYGNTPVADLKSDVIIQIRSGQSFRETVKQLNGLGLLRHPIKFRLLARIKGLDTKIQAGEYNLSASMTPNEILHTLSTGRTILYSVTIPEGYHLYQIAELLENTGILHSKRFIAAALDPEQVRKEGIEGNSFEGYLFPDTYRFPKAIEADAVIKTMVNRFREVFMPEWGKRCNSTTLSLHEVVTLASMVEKETGAPSERALIAAVFLNRLKRDMRLESDPTVIYGIEDFNGNLTREDLERYTPYNTYKIKGLPPGPIANPGLDSLKAVLNPADEPYIYFVSKNNGTHVFSRTIKEHNKAVTKYQKVRP